MKLLILLLLIFLAPKIGFAKPYTADIFYPEGDGPFPVIILSHGAGGPSVVYKKKAEGMARNGRAAVVLDHYSARGDYGAKFRNIPKLSDAREWREKDILDLLRTLKSDNKIKKETAATRSAVAPPVDSVVDGRPTADDLLSHAPPYLHRNGGAQVMVDLTAARSTAPPRNSVG